MGAVGKAEGRLQFFAGVDAGILRYSAASHRCQQCINIEIVDSSLYKERQQEGTYDMTLTVFGINNADPTSTFKQYFASEGNSNTTLNYNYYNEKIDELVAKAPTIADVEERSKIYDEIQQELFDDSACVPICYQINVNIHNKAITHYAGKTFGVGLPTISWVK